MTQTTSPCRLHLEHSPFEEVPDAAGALRPELTEPRDGGDASDSLLRLPDQTYVTAAATTSADLAALAPIVPRQTGARVIALDQTLDDDLAAWSDPETCRPRLRLLGPVEVHASGERTADVNRRCGYFTEVVAYLATRDHDPCCLKIRPHLGAALWWASNG